MKKLVLIVLSLTIFSCSERKKKDFDPLEYIPTNAELIIHSSELPAFASLLNSNNLISGNNIKLKSSLLDNLGYLPYLNIKDQAILAFSNLDPQNLQYTLITKRDSSLVKMDSVQNKSLETIRQNDLHIKKYQLENFNFFMVETGQASIFSNSEKILNNLVTKDPKMNDEDFRKVFRASDPKKTSLFLKHGENRILEDIFKDLGFPSFDTFANWSALDLEITRTEIIANGLSLGDSSILNAFNKVNAQPIESFRICPESFTRFYGLAYSSYNNLEKGLSQFRKDSIDNSYLDLFNHTREVAKIDLEEGSFFTLNAVEIESARESLAGYGKIAETYRNVNIFGLTDGQELSKALDILIKLDTPEYFAILDHFILFSDSLEVIKKTISSFQNSDTLAEKSYFQNINAKLSSESSLLFLSRLPAFRFPGQAKELNANKNGLAAFQWIVDGNFAHLHSVISNSEDMGFESNEVDQSLSIKLENPNITKPFFFKNHRTDQMDIVAQDSENNLHLLSNKGNSFWSKKMDSKITGQIHEVDLFRNGNKQLAFSTGYNMEVLDRDGNKVNGFPIRFNQPLTQPLAVFDYDNNRKYRFVLTQNKRVYMVGPNGKAIRGFDFEATKTEVIKPPKHIRLGTKDYILIAEKAGKLSILSRQGKIRVPISERFNFSENQWYGYNDHFVSTAQNSHILKIDQNGKVSREDKDLAENNRLNANNDHLVYLNENQLSINGKVIEMDFGLYTDPQLFEFRKRSLVALTDTQAQKVYVFNTDGELLPGFPVFGTSGVDIANADLDRKLEMLVLGDQNEILIYEF